MDKVLYSPPVVFFLLFFSLILFSKTLKRFGVKGTTGEHALEAYACGQRSVENYVNPDYSQYFSYAFIFTVIHVLILVVATSPKNIQVMPAIYVISGILAILIALKR